MATPQYDRENTRRINLKLNNRTDADIIQHLVSMKKTEGIQTYIKALIRADIMKGEKTMKTYKIKPEYLDLWEGGETPSDPDRIITQDELESLAADWEKPVEELLEQLIPQEDVTLTGCMITFMAGEGRHFHGGVNYLISDDRKIYAECPVQEGCSEDYGYLTMKKAIQDKTGGAVGYTFWYDGQEEHLEADASAECEVYVEID